MATPAASAWHRSRELSQRLSTTTRKSQAILGPSFAPTPLPLTSNRRFPNNVPSSYQPLDSHSDHPSNLFLRSSIPQPPPSTRTPAKFSLSGVMRSVVAPFLSLSHTVFLQIFVATIITIAFFHILRIAFVSTVGTFFLSCPTLTPHLSSFVPFVSFLLFFPLLVTLLATHSLLSIALNSSPPSKGLYLLITFVLLPIHALGFAYILYGPSLSPHQFFCAAPASVIPSRNALQLPLITSILYPPVLYVLVFQLRFHTCLSYPFPRSPLRRILSSMSHALVLAILPTLPLMPIVFLIAFLSRPERSFYTTILLTLSRSMAAVTVCTAAILPHTLAHFYEIGRTSSTTDIADGLDYGSGYDGNELMRTALSESQSPATVRSAFVETAQMPERMMRTFPPFTDPSSRLWRQTLDVVLAPLVEVATHVRVVAPRMSQGALFLSDHGANVNGGSGTAASISVGRTGSGNDFSKLGGSMLIPGLRESALREAIPVAQVLANVFEASVKYDAFGVVLPTLAHTLALLVMLHEGLCATLQHCGDQEWVSRLDGLESIGYKGVNVKGGLIWLLDGMDRRSQRRALTGLKEAVSVCVYRIVYSFREQVVRFVEGREVGWDAQANVALQPFLEFSV